MGIYSIPHGVVITAAIVKGADAGDTWTLERMDISDQTRDVLATAAVETEDSTISNATIDNNNYCYCCRCWSYACISFLAI